MKHPLLEQALIAQQQGNFVYSKDSFLSYIKVVPDDAQAYYLLGMVCNQLCEYQQSIEYLQKAIELNSESAQYFLGLGLSYDHNQQIDLAEQAYRKAELMRPDVFQVHYDIGCFMQNHHRFVEAVNYFKKTIELNSKHYPAYTNLSSAFQNLGEIKQAEKYSRKVNELVPNNVQLINNLTQLLIKQENYQEAMQLLEKAMSLDGSNIAVKINYGWLNYLVNNKNKAQQIYEETINLDPQNYKAKSMLAKCFIDKEQYVKALELLKNALKLSPSYLGSLLALAELYALQGDFEKSISTYLEGIELHPKSAELCYGLGVVYSQQGDFEKSDKYFREALKYDNKYTQALHALSNTTQYQILENDEIDLALKLVREINQNSDTLTSKQKIDLYFSLGKVYDDLKQFDIAFEYYKKGNRLRYERLPYDINEFAIYNEKSKKTFSNFNLNCEINEQALTPVFILGMPRSGTTLLEQIISSHSEVFGAGELNEIQTISKQIENYPCIDFTNDTIDFQQLNSQYTDKLLSLPNAVTKGWVVDKNPINFRHIGLIKTICPKAKIIHMQRHPLDAILSIYFQRLSEAHKYAFSLEALSNYYIKYQELMSFWEEKYAEDIIPCRYDNLVANTEQTVTDIFNKMDLAWQQNCADFYLNKRKVTTASSWQVRQPIHSESIARWKQYQNHLSDIEERLSDSISAWNKGAN